jgi:hypothetical protein
MPAVTDLQQIDGEQDLDPHQCERSDPDPHQTGSIKHTGQNQYFSDFL